MGSEALSEAVNASKKKKKKGRAGKEAKQNRRRTIGPFSVRASVKKVEGGEVLTLRNMFVAFHHPESGGPNSSSIKLAGPGMLSLLFVIVAVGFASFWLNGDWVDKAIELNGNNDIKKDDVAIVVLEPGLARRAFGQCRATREKRRMIQS